MELQDIRKKAKMSQRQLAEYFGIPKRTIENWEEGKSKMPTYLLDLVKYKLKKEKLI